MIPWRHAEINNNMLPVLHGKNDPLISPSPCPMQFKGSHRLWNQEEKLRGTSCLMPCLLLERQRS